MKPLKKECPAPLPSSQSEREIRLTRRSFLKGAAGFVLLCGAGFEMPALTASLSEEIAPVGPQLVDGLSIDRTDSGAEVTSSGLLCFTVNEEGERLLRLADGSRTLEEIIRLSGLSSQAEAVVDFFLTLGQAGYLTARLEVNKVAVCL